jgi:hypothetical protein
VGRSEEAMKLVFPTEEKIIDRQNVFSQVEKVNH